MAKRKRSAIVKELDKWFSLYIRLRDSDSSGNCICVTCGKYNHYKKQQAGHFQSRRHYSTRWDKENVQIQCYGCNVGNQGEQFKFAKWLDDNYESGKAEELEVKAKQTVKYSDEYLMEKIKLYKEYVKSHKNYEG